MPKVAVVPLAKARRAAMPVGLSGDAATSAVVGGDRQPLLLHHHEIGSGGTLHIGPRAADCLAYVWKGAVIAGGCRLEAGSSLIVEHGAGLEVFGEAGGAEVLTFTARDGSAQARAGGHVHLLPAGRVPKSADMGGGSNVGGGMHADAACPTCEIWLHENHFPAMGPLSPEEQVLGVHSHSEDEIIFVTAGRIRLGNRLFDAGTAVAIAADTLYSLSAGPEGMSFINFRAGTPGDIRFASGMAISETGYWRERLPRPDYLAPDA